MISHDSEIFYRRRLPHYQPPDATYFITFRLNGSLPAEVVEKMIREREEQEEQIAQIKDEQEKEARLATCRKFYFGKFDALLDRGETGPKWLKNPKIAEIVTEAIRYRDNHDYDLLAYCVMPNHVHLVFYVGRFAESTRRNSVSRYI